MVAGISSWVHFHLHGVNFIVTVHKMPATGHDVVPPCPLFLWSIYATSVIQVLATPVLAITLMLLVAERTLGIGFFDPRWRGPDLFQHFSGSIRTRPCTS